MKRQYTTLVFLGITAILSTGNVIADDLCTVPEANRQPIESLQSKLESEGWEIKKLKVDDGCYEAYAINAEGQKVEAYFDPQTFALIKSKID